MVVTVVLFGYSAYLVFNVSAGIWRDIQKLRQDQVEKLAVGDQLQNLIAKASELLARYTDLDQRSRPISASLPSDPKLAEILAIIGATTQKNNMILSQVTFEEIRTTEPVQGPDTAKAKTVKTNVSLMGNYSDFKRWLKDLETELRLIDITEVSFQPVSLQAGESTLSFSMGLLAYWHPLVETISPR